MRRRDECGATAVEFALVTAMVAAVTLGAFALVGGGLGAPLEAVNQVLAELSGSGV